MKVLSDNYRYLMNRCNFRDTGNFCSQSYADIFQNTILFVVQDKEAAVLRTDKEILDHFCYRYQMIMYQTTHDDAMLKEVEYADYTQAEEADQQ